MPLPTLSAAQIEWIVQRVVAYIKHQRQTYRPDAVSLTLNQRNAMRPFFREPALDSASRPPRASRHSSQFLYPANRCGLL